jgi:acyl-CoA synthetase (AMP-forming)/AMP-acid ligase II
MSIWSRQNVVWVWQREWQRVRAMRHAATAEDVIAYCKEKLAVYKYPALDRVRDALPKGPTGKILERELR